MYNYIESLNKIIHEKVHINSNYTDVDRELALIMAKLTVAAENGKREILHIVSSHDLAHKLYLRLPNLCWLSINNQLHIRIPEDDMSNLNRLIALHEEKVVDIQVQNIKACLEAVAKQGERSFSSPIKISPAVIKKLREEGLLVSHNTVSIPIDTVL